MTAHAGKTPEHLILGYCRGSGDPAIPQPTYMQLLKQLKEGNARPPDVYLTTKEIENFSKKKIAGTLTQQR